MVAPRVGMLRRVAEAVSVDSCVISRPTYTPNDSGGGANTYVSVATVKCRIRSVSSREALIGGETATEADGIAVLPAATDIRQADRIISGGYTYEVTGVPVAASEEVARKVFIRLGAS